MPKLGIGFSLITSIVRAAGALVVPPITYVTDQLKLYFNFAKESLSDEEVLGENPSYTGHKTVQFASAGSTEFATTNNHIDTGTTIGGSLGDGCTALSAGGWIKNTSTAGDHGRGVVYIGDFASTNGEWTMTVYNDLLSFHVNNGGTSCNFAYTDTNIWHHWMCTYDGIKIRSYLDGVEVNSTAFTAGLDMDGLKTIIGGNYASSQYFTGNIANIGVWSRGLAVEEVQSIMHKQYADFNATEKESLRGWWNFDDTTAVVNSNSSILVTTTGTVGSSGGNLLTVPYHSDFAFGDDDFTIEFWFYMIAGPATEQSILFGIAESNSSDANGQLSVMTTASGGSILKFGYWEGSGTPAGDTWTITGSGGAFPTATWTHVAAVRDGDTFRLYRAGAQVGTQAVSSFDMSGLGGDIHIGEQSYNNTYGSVSGNFIEYRISNTCRYPDGTTFTPHTTPHVVDSNTKFLMRGDSITDVSDTPHTITNSGATVSGGANITAPDSHTTNNDGTITGASTDISVYGGNAPKLPRSVDIATETFGDAIGGGSFDFGIGTGEQNQVSIPGDGVDLSGDFTLMCWCFKQGPEAEDNDNPMGSPGYGNSFDGIRFYVGSDNKVNPYAKADGGRAISIVATPTDTFGKYHWFHVALSRNVSGTEWRLYYNGIYQSDTTNATNYTTDADSFTTDLNPSGESVAQQFAIGSAVNDSWWEGYVAQFGHWTRVLTDIEVQSVMEKTYSEFTDAEKVGLRAHLPLDTAPLKAFDFNNQNIDCGTSLGTAFGADVQAITMAVWFASDVHSADDGIISFDNLAGWGANKSLHMTVGGSTLGFQYFYNDGSNRWVGPSTGFTAAQVDVPTLMIGTFDGTAEEMKQYVDGVLKGSAYDFTTAPSSPDLDIDGRQFNIGNHYNGSYGFDGRIFKVGVWDAVLDADDVEDIYELGVGGNWLGVSGIDDPVGYWDLNNNNKSLSFDGSGDYGTLTMPALGEVHTISVWFNITAVVGENLYILLDSTALGTLFFGYRSDGGSGYRIVSYDYHSGYTLADTTLSIDTWYHAVYVRNGTSGLTYYLNASADGTHTSGTRDFVGTSAIGGRASGSYQSNARIANMSVWDTALDQDDITALYAIDKYASISGHSKFVSNCKGFWLMDNASTVQDLTSSNADIAITNAVLSSEIPDSSANSNTGAVDGPTQVDAVTLDSTSNHNDGVLN